MKNSYASVISTGVGILRFVKKYRLFRETADVSPGLKSGRKYMWGKMYLLMLALVWLSQSLHAQLTGSKNIPGDYATLAAAITDLNVQGVGVGGVTLNLIAGNPQTAPAGGYVIGGTGSAVLTTTSSTKTVIIQGNGNVITAFNPQSAGALNDAVFKLIGADWITITGFVMQENALNSTTTAASNNMTEWGVALLHVSTADGAQNNTIQANTISLNKAYTNTWGVYANNRHSATSVTITEDVANNTTGPNSNNKVYGNSISNVNLGIAFIGTSAAANQDVGNDVGGSSLATGNTISNWGGAAAASGYISNSGTSYCIFLNHQVGDNISYNTLTSAAVSGTSVTFRGIFKDYTVTAPTGTFTSSITNNTVTMSSGFTSGTFEAIRSQGMTTLSTATININSNTILNCALTGAASSSAMVCIVNSSAPGTLSISNNIIRGNTSTATSGGFTGISNTGAVVTSIAMNNNQVGNASGNAITFSAATSGAVTSITNTGGAATANLSIQSNDIRGIVHSVAGTSTHTYIINSAATLSQNISSNTFTNLSVNTTGGVTFISNSVSAPTGGAKTVNTNSIVTAFNKGSAGGTVTLYLDNASSVAGVVVNNNNNNFSNITLSGATTMAGWSNTDGGQPTKNIQGNTFSNWMGGSNGITVMNINFGSSSTTSLSSNVISAISAGGAITGIVLGSSIGTVNCSLNVINGLASTGASVVTGISSASTSANLFKNKIYDLSSNNAGGTVNGIAITAGTSPSIYNNLIGDLRATAASAADAVRGINITSTTTSSTINVSFNTIYLSATSTGANFGSTGLFHTVSATATTASLNLRSNIIVNVSTPNGTGLTVAYRRSGTALNNYGSISNSNLFYSGVPSVSRLIFYDGTNSDQTLSAYKTRVAPRDASSVTENPPFLSTTGSDPTFLHINTTIPTQTESGGIVISGITDDYDGDTRNVSTPDIGADEFSGMAADMTGPAISYTIFGNTSCTNDRMLTATITDASGVDVNPGTKPRLYFKKFGDANTFAGNTSADNGWKYVEATNGSSPFSFTTNYTLLQSPVMTGDVIQYFVVAQDMAGVPNVGINSGVFNATPVSVNLLAGDFPITGSINSYTLINPGLSGMVTVGSGGTYPTLTGAGGLFADLNTKGMSGALEAIIISTPIAETGANALNAINYNGCASGPFPLTIHPGIGVTAVLSGAVASNALVKLNGADFVTIDGSNSGGTDRSLTITNTSTTAPTAIGVISLGIGAGATDINIKNCNISTGIATSIGYGISVGGTTPGTNGADNDNVTLLNNNITVAPTAIFALGTASISAGGDDNLMIIGNSVDYNGALAGLGIRVGSALNALISQNQVSMESSATQAPTAISLETGLISSSIVKNNITKSKNTNTGGYGGRGITVGTGLTSSNLTIANNFISGVSGTDWSSFTNSSSMGIVLGVIGNSSTLTTVAGGLKLYYNSINMYGSIGAASSTAITTAIYVGTGASALDVRNNIFVNNQSATSGTQKNYGIYCAAAASAFSIINFNDYYASDATFPASAILGFLGSDKLTLAAWQAATMQDGASKNINPAWVSNSDLHIVGTNPANYPLENGATPVSITDDIDGDIRMTDIGADEFLFEACTGAVAGTASVSGPSSFCVSGSATITSTGYTVDEGISYEWFKSTDNFVANSMTTGQTNPASFNTGTITGTTYYRLKVTCASNNAMAFSNIVTITINALPVVTCPPNFSICVDAPAVDLTSLSYGPVGGSFSGAGVTGNMFNPGAAGTGSHVITYSYTDGNMCTNTCTFTITVNALPVVTCPPAMTVCEADDPFLLTGATPTGGTYAGTGVMANMFDPGVAGPGTHMITYFYTDGNMCTNTCSFLVAVTPSYICNSFMDWVLLPPGFVSGSCTSGTDCCEDILCYGLQYTPGTTGTLTDYTTGFLVNCVGGNNPVLSNMSCTMTDNSFEINGCMSDNLVLFNSSGYDGMLPVTMDVPVILHKVCFNVPVGSSLTIVEDTITNLTTSIEVAPNNTVVEFPVLSPTTITRTGLADPMDGASTVQCVADAVPPVTPVVVDQCGSPVTPMLVSVVDNPDPLLCEGTRIYTYFYTDCSGFSTTWSFTYTIDRTIPPAEVGGPVPTSMNVVGIDNAVPPMLPMVEDVCDMTLEPVLISVVDNPDPIVCSGTRVYTYKWTDCAGLMFTWTFTYNIDNVPVMSCPPAFAACNNDLPFALTGATPAGGTYSGPGVSMGQFDPGSVTPGMYTITYSYTNAQGCTNTCNFQITVKAVPVVTCPANASVCLFEDAFPIPDANPPGGTYSGPGVSMGLFDPGVAGVGPHTITYTYTAPNGCTNTCTFVYNVTNCPGDPIIEIIPLDPCMDAGQYGTCNFEGSCCDNILCFAIRYTPGYSGTLTSYTTGFFIDCVNGNSPIVYNQSCVMADNSFEAPMCEGGIILFNSSGNTGSLPITQGVPVILHRICVQIPPGDTLDVLEDIITDLTASIDLTGGGQIDEFPNYVPVQMIRSNPVIPIPDGSATVACLSQALPPTPPAVFDQCCAPVIPGTPVITDTPNPLTCEGTRKYTYTYTDCGGGTSVWHFTYTIEYQPFNNPMDGGMTVSCPDDTDIPPVLPTVTDNCGNVLTPGAPLISAKPLCEGPRTYTYLYTDCEGNTQDWVFTYTVDRLDFAIPEVNDEVIVACPAQADPQTVILPVVYSDCDELLTPSAPVLDAFETDTYNGCEGTITYTWTYMDCANHSHTWTFTFIVDYSGALTPPMNTTSTVSCPAEATDPGAPAPIMDACGRTVNAVLVGATYMPDPLSCEGTVEWRYRYTACDGITSADWTHTYTVDYSGGLMPPMNTTSTVSCPAQATDPGAPAPIMDACGRTVVASFFDVTYTPDPLVCEGMVVWRYRYTACDGTTTAFWTHTYTVDYSGGLNPPMNTMSTVSCPAQATDPGAPASIMDACGRTVVASFFDVTYTPDPLLCEGMVVWRYQYTACDGTTTAFWTHTYIVDYSGGLMPPSNGQATVSCPDQVEAPLPPASIMDACGRVVNPVFIGIEQVPDPVTCEGSIVYRYRYTACDGVTTADWIFTYTIDYSGGLTPPMSTESTVSCPAQATDPGAPAPIMDACGRTVMASFFDVTYTPDPLLCEGIVVWRYRYLACDGTTTAYWTHTYTVDYSGSLMPPMNTLSTVSCPAQAVDPGAPAPIMDACGRMVSAVLVGATYTPDPLSCEGAVEWRYRYTACDGTTTADWTHTYTVDYSGGLTPPMNTTSTVSCPAQATDPGAPANIMDACGRTVSASFYDVTYTPDPLVCEGMVVWRYRYIACDGTTTAFWTHTYTVDYSGGLTPPMNTTSTVSCPSQATDPGAPVNIMDACGRTVSAVLVGATYTPDPLSCEGAVEWRYRYTACDGTTTADWTHTYTVDYSGGLIAPMNVDSTVSCPADAVNPGPPANILDACGRSVAANFIGVEQTPDPVTCEGTIVYRYRYTACDGTTTADWTFTYTIDYNTPLVPPMNGSSTVACAALAVNPGSPAAINDACGRAVNPILIGSVSMPDPLTCEGTVVWTYRYTACDGMTMADWTYTYTIEYEPFTILDPLPVMVTCPQAAEVPPMLPIVEDNCEVVLTPVDVTISPALNCEGTKTYTYLYTDCEGNSDTWTYSYIVDVPAPMVPAPVDVTVECPDETDVQPVPPQVADPCNMGFITPTGPVVSAVPECEGVRTYTWTYANCAGETTQWVYTYHVIRTTPPDETGDPVGTEEEIYCYLDATPPAILPEVTDICGVILPAPVPVVGGTNTGGCGGTITYTYTYTDCAGLEKEWVYTYYITCDAIELHVWLEGPYSITGDSMRTTLNNSHTLPGQLNPPFIFDQPAGQPYTVAPWNYSGNLGTTFGDGMGMTPYPVDVVDWVLVIIRQNGLLPANNIWTCAGWVHKDGKVTFPENCPLPVFNGTDTYYFLVQHRNHLGILSPSDVNMPCGTAVLEWDFRNSNSYQPLFRFGQKQVEPGVWAMFAANGDQTNSIQAINSFDRTLWKVWQGFLGYSPGDYDLNASTNSIDETIWKNNQNRTSGVVFY